MLWRIKAVAYTQDQAFELLESAYHRGRLAHAFLLIAENTKVAEKLAIRLACMLNQEEEKEGEGMFDLFGEVEAAPVMATNVESVEELEGDLVRVIKPRSKSRQILVEPLRDLEKAMYQSIESGKTRVGVILEADRMNQASSNAFLKTLEEPPDHSVLILTTTKPETLLQTILSRCVKISLIDGKRELSESEKILSQELAEFSKRGFGSDEWALRLGSCYTKLLQTSRETLEKLHKEHQKQEQEKYAKTTDGSWLKGREAHYDAMARTEVLHERMQLFGMLYAWMGDLLKVKCGVRNIRFPEQLEAMQSLVEKESVDSLIQRLSGLEELRRYYETNVSEPLAQDVCFIKAFG